MLWYSMRRVRSRDVIDFIEVTRVSEKMSVMDTVICMKEENIIGESIRMKDTFHDLEEL